jgi:hypothetical protein
MRREILEEEKEREEKELEVFRQSAKKVKEN